MAIQRRPLMTTTVGSFPRPPSLASTDRGSVQFRLDGEALAQALDKATADVLQEQVALGIDVLTDGEMRRLNFIRHTLESWDGFDFDTPGLKTVFRNRKVDRMVPRVVGRVERRRPANLSDLRFAKAKVEQPLKIAVPGPMTIVDSTLDDHYGDEEALAMDSAAALNAELRDLQDAGCDMLQIDEPAMTRYHDKVRAYGARALTRCIEGLTVPTIVHLCYGYPGGPDSQHHFGYPDLLPLLMDTPISGFNVEFARSDYDPAILRVCGDRLIMFGCIDPGNTPAPEVEAVKRRVAGALEHLAPDQVLLSPDCGLMTIDRALAHAKLRVMVDAARSLRAEL